MNPDGVWPMPTGVGSKEPMGVQLLRFETECEELADGSVRVCAHGELDMATASTLERALVDCTREHHSRVIVDLADVPFMDASGLRVLLSAHDRQRKDDGELVITHPSRQVVRLLDVAQRFTKLPLAQGLAPPAGRR